jgi:hypothetical protein
MTTICPPAMIYIVFSITQIIIDIVKGLYNTAFMKFIVMTIIGFLLNILCLGGLGIISWIIVFIPFVLMTIITALLLYAFGLNATTGKIKDIPETSPETLPTIDEVIITEEPPTEDQKIDPRCFVMPASSTQLHGMRTNTNDQVYCPWDADAE